MTADELSWLLQTRRRRPQSASSTTSVECAAGIASDFNFRRSDFVKLQLLGRDDTVGRAR
jgi:hypothetical protein